MVDQRPDQLSEWQKQAMAVPESFDLALAGGRGGGKTRLLFVLFLRHAEQWKDQARCLVVRRSFPGLSELESDLHAFLSAVYGHKGFNHDRRTHKFTLPNGATIQLDQLESERDFSKYQGKSFSHIAVDEAGQFASPALVDRLRSSLRAPRGIPLRFIILANPGGSGHHWLAKRYAMRQSWVPFTDEATGGQFVTIASTYRDNEFIDRDRYAANLRAACATDPELARAWLDGDWSVIRGAYFAHVLDTQRTLIEAWPYLPHRINHRLNKRSIYHHDPSLVTDWRIFLAHDFGVSAPSVTYLVARSPGHSAPDGVVYPKDSIILLDEITTAHPDDETQSTGLTVPEQAAAIVDMCRQWQAKPQGVADDAIFNRTGGEAGSIAQEFQRNGVMFQRAHKGGRVAGWQTVARLLQDSGKPDKPGLYVSRRCAYWWATVPNLPRDPRRPEDIDTTGPDHAADACRYACTAEFQQYPRTTIRGVG